MIDYSSLLSGLGGVLGGGVLLRFWLASREARISELAREVVQLRDRTVSALSARVERHCDADQSQGFAAKLETVIAQNNEILRDLKKLDRETAEQGQKICNNAARLDGLHRGFREHTSDRSVHHG